MDLGQAERDAGAAPVAFAGGGTPPGGVLRCRGRPAGREPPGPRRSAARPRSRSLRGARGRARPERVSGLLSAAPCAPAGTAAGHGARTVQK